VGAVIGDPLTGVAARDTFLAALAQAVEAARDGRHALALVVVDLDGFARINGAFGYAFGDALLQHVGHVLRRVARSQDLAGRLDGDRFALVLPRVMNAGHAELAAQKLFRLLDAPFRHGGRQVRIGASAGIALVPHHALRVDDLLRLGEKMVQRARRAGRPYALASDQAAGGGESAEEWDIEIALDGALERGELEMHFQPQVRLADGRPVGVEALMRWHNPERGDVPPGLFIPVAERTGQIRQMTIWALNAVLRQAGRWTHPWGMLDVAVNVPAELVAQADLPGLVDSARQLWGSSQARLSLEITERSLMDPRQAFDVLQRIRSAGVRVSIDDFGTGYSCLATFKDVPADELKIDRSFVATLRSEPASRHISGVLVELAHRFGLTVVAEGIEHEADRVELAEMGCDVGQGFLIARPMPGDHLEAWLQAQAAQVAP
jgi:diguanylate cyclase (GGDEF)-like protein